MFAVPITGWYKIELWGAGGTNTKGGYSSGIIELNKNEHIYVYVGLSSGYNGGGAGYTSTAGLAGAGATDIRYRGASLNDRIMVAGGGGGANESTATVYGHAGGLIGVTGYNTSYSSNKATGGTQISGGVVTNYSSSYAVGTNGTFGVGGTGGGAAGIGSYGGGGGYYGGAGGSRLNSGSFPSGGGSSFISGHTGCVAIASSSSAAARTGTSGAACTTGTTDNLCSVHYSGKVFTNTLMIDGLGYSWTNVKAGTVGTNLMPNPSGGTYASGVGHSGNGYARITFLGTNI